ncbi:MAG: glutamine--tRNA ligase/YqeY domain fusion protein [Flavobacteriales bacterium]|nr:glutamine--tRNA ligase/YqeY domain fusion protein [Flavobacteriales bacterium]
MENPNEVYKALNFIEQIVEEDLKNGYTASQLKFRFPPEPNGYLHIGHAKAFCLNFGLGEKYDAPVNLRFDDTNPSKEEQEFVDAIKYDLSWMGFKWAEECYSSDYFQQLYEWAVEMIKNDKAYVDSQSSEAMAEQKGTPTKPGVNSPYRNRSVEENLDLFNKMKLGEFKEGEHVLRAKIDMTHTNMLMRDPIMYRVMHKHHHRTGNDWCIYPMYDWAHGESDYIEHISHSLCSLEFKPHRELYDWFLDQVYDEKNIRPKQREFSRLNLNYTVMSKRKLMKLVEDNIVDGWDDPRMPTISGLRRRGYTPAAIRDFIDKAGVSKRDQMIDVALLESCIRADLNKSTNRIMAVLNPLKLVITNYPEGKTETVLAENNPEDEKAGHREMIFSREIFIEKDDFLEDCPNKVFKLGIGKEVRLKHGYIIKGEEAIKDANGNVVEVRCTYDEKSKSGSGTEESKRKVQGTLHWVSASHNVAAQVNVYERLFTVEAPDADKEVDFKTLINPNSLTVLKDCKIELALKDAKPLERYQFQRIGYFCVDKNSTPNNLIFNRTVTLKEGW